MSDASSGSQFPGSLPRVPLAQTPSALPVPAPHPSTVPTVEYPQGVTKDTKFWGIAGDGTVQECSGLDIARLLLGGADLQFMRGDQVGGWMVATALGFAVQQPNPFPVRIPIAPQAPPSLPVPALPVQLVSEVPPGGPLPEEPPKMTFSELLNKIRCNNIVLTDSIGLGDALERLAVAISRSGVRFDENGNPTVKEVNKEVGKLILDSLHRTPRVVDFVPTSLGYDPVRPMFYEGEALSIPIHAEMVMLLKKDAPPPVFPATDDPNVASPVK